MSLVLHAHPLSSYCWKALTALYENGTPFTLEMVDLGDASGRAAFAALWPLAKMPVLEDKARGEVVPETSIIIDYLDLHYPGATRFVPPDGEAALRVRLWDRICDHYLQTPMQKIVADRIRPRDRRDPFGVAEARSLLDTALATVDRQAADGPWLLGQEFGLADLAAGPALYYAERVRPFDGTYPNALALLERLKARPSFARVLAEAEPYFQYFPEE